MLLLLHAKGQKNPMCPFGGPLSKNSSARYFQGKLLWTILSLYATVILCTNRKTSASWFFMKLENLHLGPISGPISLKTLKWDFFFFKKTPALSLFKFDDIVTSCKKIQKKILWPIPEQNSGQTDRKSKCKNGRRVFHSTFTSYVQVISNVLRDLVTIVQFKKREK